MDNLVGLIVWPTVVLILGIIFLIIFRAQLGALIARTKKVSTGGLEAYDQPAPPSEEKKAIEEFFKSYDNPLLLEAEQYILQDLKIRRIEGPVDREKALVRALAASHITQHFEQVYSTLWASQAAVLRYLNPRDAGAEQAELIPLYEAAKASYPHWYQDYSFDRWLGFLKHVKLVTENGPRWFITVAGREFLKYIVATAKPGPYHG